jgi:hypothetical protein
VTADRGRYGELKDLLAGSDVEAAAGESAVLEAAGRPADIVMAAIVGAGGLKPTLAAVRAGTTVALANKECLVCAGALFMAEARDAKRGRDPGRFGAQRDSPVPGDAQYRRRRPDHAHRVGRPVPHHAAGRAGAMSGRRGAAPSELVDGPQGPSIRRP